MGLIGLIRGCLTQGRAGRTLAEPQAEVQNRNHKAAMRIADRIRTKLEAGLSPATLEIVDDSHKHAGHAGAREGGETHFTVTVVSDAFAGKSRVERQRMVYGLLADEIAERVHALALNTRAPGE
jgi:BolA protein